MNWSSSTNSLFVMQTLANSQVSELIAKHWIEGQSFYQLRRIQILELEGKHVLKPFGLFQVVFKFLQVFAPYLPRSETPFNSNFKTPSILFLHCFTYASKCTSNFWFPRNSSSCLKCMPFTKLLSLWIDALILLTKKNNFFLYEILKRIKG